MGVGTKTAKTAVQSTVGEATAKIVDYGPADRLEEKVGERAQKVNGKAEKIV
jgi:hypothetical protein